MTKEEIRAELGNAIFQNEIKISSLSDRYYNTYLVTFSFRNSELQQMFHVKPLNEDGEEIPEDYYFVSEMAACKFMVWNKGYHTINWWVAMKSRNHRKYNCMVNLFMVRYEKKGGVQ